MRLEIHNINDLLITSENGASRANNLSGKQVVSWELDVWTKGDLFPRPSAPPGPHLLKV